MISNFNEEAQEIMIKAKLEMLELRHPYVGTEHLVLAILHSDNEVSKNLIKYDLTYNRFKKEILNIIGKGSKKSEFFLHTPLLKKVIENAIMDSKDNNQGSVTIHHLFGSLLDVGEGIAIRIFIGMGLDVESMYDEFSEKLYETKGKKKKLLIEELGININERVKEHEIDPVIGREKEIHYLEEILCRRTKNNPLLIGEPGVGKTAIVEGLATLIENYEVPTKLQNKKIISLDMASAVAGTKYRGEFEERIKKMLSEIEEHEEIILFIDEIHTLIGAGGAEGAIDASNILKPALARGKIRCIGATTNDEYKKHFEKDKALTRRFQIINIEEPSIEETKNILYRLKPIYEKYHNVRIENHLIDDIITITEKYIYDRFRPDKQIDILDEACSKVGISKLSSKHVSNIKLKEIRDKKELYIKENNIKKAYECKIKETKYSNMLLKEKETSFVTIDDIANIINSKTGIPIYEILNDHKRIIDEIENNLKKNIVGQDKAIKRIMAITKMIKLGYHNNNCFSFLFVGPPGTGKTKLANIYGEIVSKQKIIKIDMSEFSDSMSISKFIGGSAGYVGYNDNKYVLREIKDNPNSVIIFDEIDKAHPKIVDIIKQILEDGKIKDAKNNIIKFNNIIIMTTNKGYKKQNIGFTNEEHESNELTEVFSPSFINRIDEIIYFKPLEKDDIMTIINNEITKLKEKYSNISINIDKNIINELITNAKYQDYGASNINKIIRNHLENIIVDGIINNQKEVNIDSIFSK